MHLALLLFSLPKKCQCRRSSVPCQLRLSACVRAKWALHATDLLFNKKRGVIKKTFVPDVCVVHFIIIDIVTAQYYGEALVLQPFGYFFATVITKRIFFSQMIFFSFHSLHLWSQLLIYSFTRPFLSTPFHDCGKGGIYIHPIRVKLTKCARLIDWLIFFQFVPQPKSPLSD